MQNSITPFAISLAILLPLQACNAVQDDSGGSEPTPVASGGGATSPGFASGGITGGGLIGLPFGVAGGPMPARLSELRTAASPPPAISGGSLAVSADGSMVVAADPDRDAVFVVHTKSLQVERVALSEGSEPGRVALDGQGGAHVALRRSGKLARIDLASPSVTHETAACEHPRGVTYDPQQQAVLVSCMDGQLISLDAGDHGERSRAALAHDLRDVVVGADGSRWVARYRSAELLALAEDHSVTRTTLPDGIETEPGLALPPGALIDGGLSSLFGDAGLPPGFDKIGKASPTLAWRALPSASGGVWMLHQQSEEGPVQTGPGGYGGGCRPITSGAITEFSGDGTPKRSMPIALQGLSVDFAVSPDQKWIAVASPGAFAKSAGSVQIYSTSSLAATPPAGVCPTPSGTVGGENQTVAVAFDDDGTLYAFSREPAELSIYHLSETSPPDLDAGILPVLLGQAVDVERSATVALDLGSVRDTGHDLFHADVGSGLACASCHGEALDDGHVWNFAAIGPRRTQNMRGGLLATAPFHWDGDMDTMGHLVDNVMTGRMGGFQVVPEYAVALGTWIDQQPALSLAPEDAASAARGKQLFESKETACVTCHSGPAFTNNKSADVGTGGAFQVPGLRGVGLRAPYMHNGCAQTLMARFSDESCGGGDKHGKTSQLSAEEKADLVAYLSSL